MNTTEIGQRAEKAVVKLLQQNGFHVLDQNWKTRLCEIDIVARRADIVYFVEVKYRTTSMYGSGLEYITPTKLCRVHFAAELWSSVKGYQGNYRLLAAEVTGANFQAIRIVEV